jgi:hypothetical protein
LREKDELKLTEVSQSKLVAHQRHDPVFNGFTLNSDVQPFRNSPQVATGHLKVATDSCQEIDFK